MTAKKIALRIIVALIVIVTVGAIAGYFMLSESRPWTALLIACCGGVFDVNLLAVLYLTNRNFKN